MWLRLVFFIGSPRLTLREYLVQVGSSVTIKGLVESPNGPYLSRRTPQSYFTISRFF